MTQHLSHHAAVLFPTAHCRRWAFLCSSFLGLLSLGYAQSTPGRVEGRVANQATGAFLEGARVGIEGTSTYTLTDRQGNYSLPVPPGEVTLRATYAGLDPQTAPLTVSPGERVVHHFDLTSEVYALEAFTVAGPREGSALAITQQRMAPNVKNVVSSDSFGNVADGNIGDFLQQIPGISAVYVGADVRSVQIRGIDGALNTVTMDGDSLASSQSAGLGRTFEFEQASLAMIETIEVIKAPTPDMDAASIGGNVNLVTKGAFDRRDPRLISYAAGGVYRPGTYRHAPSKNKVQEPFNRVGPSINFTYADAYSLGGKEKNFGVMVNGTYHSQPGGDTANLMNYAGALNEIPRVYSISPARPAGAPRTRAVLGVKFDYKWSEFTTVSLNTSYNWFHERNDTRTMNLQTAQAAANFGPNTTALFSEIRQLPGSFSQLTRVTNDKSGRTILLTPSVRHRWPGLEIDYGVSYSNSMTFYEDSPYGRSYQATDQKGTLGMRLSNVGWTVDRRQSLQYPRIEQTAGADIYDLSNYAENVNLVQNDRTGEDTVKSGRFNFKKQIDLPVPTFVKTGLTYREQTRRTASHARRYYHVGPDGQRNTPDDHLGEFALDLSGRAGDDTYAGYRPAPVADLPAVARYLASHPERWQEDFAYAREQRLNNDRRITETVSAAYVMGETRLGYLGILGGLRVERTETDAEGPLRSGTEFIGRQRSRGKYQNGFPGVHFTHSHPAGLVTRASYSSSIGRPGFASLIPLDTVNEAAQTVTRSNPALRPQYSDNFDVSVEYYFEPVGQLSASLFLKEVTDFIFTRSDELVPGGPDNGYNGLYEGYQIVTQDNGGSARYRGYELNYQQQFRFLPGFWQGFGMNMNYTYLETEGDYGSPMVTNVVAGFIPKIGNVGLSYVSGKWNVRLNAVWRGRHLVANSTNPALLRYHRPKTQLNLKLKYNLSPRFGFFCDIENLNESPITDTYFAAEDRPAEIRKTSPKVVAGITGRF